MKKYIKVIAVLVAFFMIADVAAAATGYGGGGRSSKRRASSSNGQVLGATTSAFKFNNDLTIGSTGQDVVELQNRLRAAGFFTFPTSTGYFGPITRSAVAAYQASRGITPAVGFFGPITRASMNL